VRHNDLRRFHYSCGRAGAVSDLDALADLYDPLTMPGPLLRAHQELDRAVDRCYRPEPFPSDRHRVGYLFALYELTAPLAAAAKPGRKRRKLQTAPPLNPLVRPMALRLVRMLLQ